MKKQRYLLPSIKDFVFFVDKKNHSEGYAMTKEEHERKNKILKDYDYKEENVPDDITIGAYKLSLVDDTNNSYDIYDIISKTEISFPINRIEWIFVYVSELKQ